MFCLGTLGRVPYQVFCATNPQNFVDSLDKSWDKGTRLVSRGGFGCVSFSKMVKTVCVIKFSKELLPSIEFSVRMLAVNLY